MKFVKFGIFAFALSLFTMSCGSESTTEEAAEDMTEHVEEAADDAGEMAEEAAEAVDSTMTEAAENVEEAAHDEAH